MLAQIPGSVGPTLYQPRGLRFAAAGCSVDQTAATHNNGSVQRTIVLLMARPLRSELMGSNIPRRQNLSASVQPLHGVLIDIVRDRLALHVAGDDGTPVVHATPHPGVVCIRARRRDAAVR